MKIALVLDDSLARPDGVQEYVRTIAKAMGERGHEVHVLCSGEAGPAPEGVASVVSVTANVAVNFNGNSQRTPRPASAARIREILATNAFDVIHVQSPHSPLFAGKVVREARRMYGAKVRIIGSFVILPDSSVSAWSTRFLGLLLRSNLRKFDGFVAISGPAVDFADWAFGVRPELLGAPIDVAAVKAQAQAKPWIREADGRLVVAFLGRLVERKGAVELVEAVAALPDQVRSNFVLRLGGRGPLADHIRGLIATHGLGDVVTMEGFIADEDKPGFLAAADIAVFPATGGESFGIVLTEAMAAGAGVVLAGNNPGYAWTIADPEAVVDPTDAQGFAASIEAVVTDLKLRQRLRERQDERIKDFDIASVSQRLETIYEG